MHQQPPFKYFFLILGVCLLLFSPFIILFVPTLIPMTFYFEKYTWFYYTPAATLLLFGLGIALLIICCFVLFFGNLRPRAILVSILLFLLAAGAVFVSVLHYTAVSDRGIVHRPLFTFETQQIAWSDIESAKFVEVQPTEKGTPAFHLQTKGGVEVVIKENDHVLQARGKLVGKLKQHGIELEYVKPQDM